MVELKRIKAANSSAGAVSKEEEGIVRVRRINSRAGSIVSGKRREGEGPPVIGSVGQNLGANHFLSGRGEAGLLGLVGLGQLGQVRLYFFLF